MSRAFLPVLIWLSVALRWIQLLANMPWKAVEDGIGNPCKWLTWSYLLLARAWHRHGWCGWLVLWDINQKMEFFFLSLSLLSSKYITIVLKKIKDRVSLFDLSKWMSDDGFQVYLPWKLYTFELVSHLEGALYFFCLNFHCDLWKIFTHSELR